MSNVVLDFRYTSKEESTSITTYLNELTDEGIDVDLTGYWWYYDANGNILKEGSNFVKEVNVFMKRKKV